MGDEMFPTVDDNGGALFSFHEYRDGPAATLFDVATVPRGPGKRSSSGTVRHDAAEAATVAAFALWSERLAAMHGEAGEALPGTVRGLEGHDDECDGWMTDPGHQLGYALRDPRAGARAWCACGWCFPAIAGAPNVDATTTDLLAVTRASDAHDAGHLVVCDGRCVR